LTGQSRQIQSGKAGNGYQNYQYSFHMNSFDCSCIDAKPYHPVSECKYNRGGRNADVITSHQTKITTRNLETAEIFSAVERDTNKRPKTYRLTFGLGQIIFIFHKDIMPYLNKQVWQINGIICQSITGGISQYTTIRFGTARSP